MRSDDILLLNIDVVAALLLFQAELVLGSGDGLQIMSIVVSAAICSRPHEAVHIRQQTAITNDRRRSTPHKPVPFHFLLAHEQDMREARRESYSTSP
jgi:hypothetical protein